MARIISLKKIESDPYFDGDDLQKALQKAIASLPEKQRLVFNMRYYDELKYEEISEILGTSVGALKASYHHAMKKSDCCDIGTGVTTDVPYLTIQ